MEVHFAVLSVVVFEIFQDKKFLSLGNADPVPSEFPIEDHKRHFKLGHVNLLSHFKTEVWPNSVLPKAEKHELERNNALTLLGKTNREIHMISFIGIM